MTRKMVKMGLRAQVSAWIQRHPQLAHRSFSKPQRTSIDEPLILSVGGITISLGSNMVWPTIRFVDVRKYRANVDFCNQPTPRKKVK